MPGRLCARSSWPTRKWSMPGCGWIRSASVTQCSASSNCSRATIASAILVRAANPDGEADEAERKQQPRTDGQQREERLRVVREEREAVGRREVTGVED